MVQQFLFLLRNYFKVILFCSRILEVQRQNFPIDMSHSSISRISAFDNNCITHSMSIQGELRHRESKRKIFLDEPIKSRPEQLPLPKKIPLESHNSQDQQTRKQIEQLHHSVTQLKHLLTEEREKYDQLFEEYEQLIEKNNLIEKEYINLKYEHNKEVKSIKKACKEKVEEEVKKCIDEFNSKIGTEMLTESVRGKIERLISNLGRVSESFLLKSKKYHSHQGQLKTSDLLQKLNRKEDTVITHTQRLDFYEIQEKIQSSPTKQPPKELPQPIKQVTFEDQYYGDLQDYDHLQEKLTQRRNYQLMKNVNRSSSEFRRKKIFLKPGVFQ